MSIAIVQQEPRTLQVLLLKEEGPYANQEKLIYNSLPEGVAIEEPEFEFLAQLILQGWKGPRLLAEFGELAMEGSIPSELSHRRLSIWLGWFATEVTYSW